MGLFQHRIPEESHQRRILVLMDSAEARAHRNDPWYGDLQRDDSIALVVVDPDAPLEHRVVERLRRSGAYRRNRVLAMNPFDSDDYQEPEPLVLGLPYSKAIIMRDVASQLGAESFTMEVEHKTQKATDWKVGLDASHPKGGGGALIKRAMTDLVHSSGIVSGRFDGGTPNIERASEILQRAGLFHDLQIRSLVEAARNLDNRVLEHACRLEMTSEATRTIELTLKAIVPKVIECKGEFKRTTEERTEYRMNFCVKWKAR